MFSSSNNNLKTNNIIIMKFTIDRDALMKPLQQVAGVVERRQTLPVLTNILLTISKNKLSMIGTDLEVEMQTHAPLVDAKEGEITVPARKFLDICRALPDQSEIQFSLTDSKAVIRSSKSRFVLSTLPATDFPNIEINDSLLVFSISQATLKNAIERSYFAMAQQDVRYYLNGMLFEINANHLTLVATDGHRLAVFNTKGTIETEKNQQVIVPRKGVIELMKLLSDDDQAIEIQLGNNYIRFSTADTVFTSKLIDGRFPDYHNVVPKNTNKLAVCEREILRQALSRVSILSNEKYRGVRMTFSRGLLRILTQNPEQEEAEEEIAVDYKGEDLEIGFNVNYLVDAISAGSSSQIQLSLSDANSCCLIEGIDEQDCQYVVMPMRL
jgi:DNA polymerase-3 subunit beta